MLAKSVDGNRLVRLGLFLGVALAGVGVFARPASATAPPFRSLNLPANQFELGLGAGVGHRGDPLNDNGLGVNLELGYGISHNLELRFRTGLRFGVEARSMAADRYARPVETETYDTGSETIANPELGLRFNLVHGATAEIALDAKAYLPLSGRFGVMAGVPLALHLGNRLVLDTGVFIPVIFEENSTYTEISIPMHLWIKSQGGVFFGPMTGVIFPNHGDTVVPFGVGVGTALSYDADVRFWVIADDIANGHASSMWGGGVGLYINF